MNALSVEVLNQPAQAVARGGRVELRVVRAVLVMPLCFAIVPHDTFITVSEGCTVILVPASTVFQAGLLVGPKVVADGSITTNVFNMTAERLWIKKDDIISLLVAL